MASNQNLKHLAEFIALLSILTFIMGFGCAFYSFSGSLAPHLKTVAVAQFDNRTAEFGVSEEMTDTLVDEFQRDNSLKIADRNTADVLVEGEIIRVDDRAGAFDQSERVQDFKLYVTVRVKCSDQVKRQPLWEERITQWGSYDPSAGSESRLEGMSEAIGKISQEVLNKTVAGW